MRFFSFKKKRRFKKELLQKKVLEEKEIYSRKPEFTFKKSFSFFEKAIFVLIALILAGLFYFLFLSRYFQITDIAVIGVRESVAGQIKDEVKKDIDKMRFKSIFLFKARGTEEKLKKQFFILKSVKINRKLPGIIKVQGEEKTAAAIIHSGQKYFFLDNESFIFEEISLTRLAITSLPIIENKGSNKKIKVGDRVLSSRFMEFVLALQKELPEKAEIEIIEISIPAFASREVHVRVKSGFIVYFDIQRSVESQVLALQKTLSEVIKGEELEKLQYIDLRVENKVFYYPSNIEKSQATLEKTP